MFGCKPLIKVYIYLNAIVNNTLSKTKRTMKTETADKTLEEFKQLCRAHGCKCTPQRYAVYRYICGNLLHPDVNTVWSHVSQEIPSITRESVFRILNEFVEFGVIGRVTKVSETRFDGRAENHGHMICEKCGAVIDFDLPDSLKDFSASESFLTKHIELQISGLCEKCAQDSNAHTAKKDN